MSKCIGTYVHDFYFIFNHKCYCVPAPDCVIYAYGLVKSASFIFLNSYTSKIETEVYFQKLGPIYRTA